MKSTKGQVTVFIIIGIILVLVSLFTYYLIQQVTVQEVTAGGRPVLERVPQEFQSIQAFTESCIQSTGETALLLLGQQGGYIDTTPLGEFSETNPTEGNGVVLGDLQVPYWHFNSAPNRGNKVVFSSHQPSLHQSGAELSIESQLNSYLEAKLPECLNDYQLFLQQGFDVQRGDIEAKTSVTNQGVQFLVEIPLELRKGESTVSPELFYAEVPLKLKEMYGVADTIANVQQNASVVERHGLELVSIFSAPDLEHLPPTSLTTFEPFPIVFWNERDVQQNFQRLLSSYVPLLQVLGSSNFHDYIYAPAPSSDLFQSTRDNMVLPLQGAEDLEVSFDYFNWPLYLDTNSRNGVIQPYHTSMNYKVVHFNMQNYDTHYDLSYPVLVTLRDPEAFGGKGYEFLFALESNIRNNQPAVADEVQERYPAQVSRLACDKEAWEAGPLRTIVVDSSTQEPLAGVQLGFMIPEQDNCQIGLTDETGSVDSTYPAVYGGVVSLIKPEYLTNFYPIDTYKQRERSGLLGYAVAGFANPAIEMHPYKTVTLQVKKKEINKCITYPAGVSIDPREVYGGDRGTIIFTPWVAARVADEETYCFGSSRYSEGNVVQEYKPEFLGTTHRWIFSDTPQPLAPAEEAFVTLERVADLREEVVSEDFSQVVQVKGTTPAEIQLVPGMYKVTGQLLNNQEMALPKEERCTGGVVEALACWDTDGCCYTMDQTKLEKVMAGQLAWETPETYLRITPEDLYGSQSLTIYFPAVDLPAVPAKEHVRIVEDMQMMGKVAEISQQKRVALQPEFK